MKISPYFTIIRIQNAVMVAGAVLLGNWIADAGNSIVQLIMLTLAAIASLAFGNVINDIVDIQTDIISHPDRPLPRGDISKNAAIIYALILLTVSLLCASAVSHVHTIATLVPLVLLTLYSLYLKRTPLTGNILVAALVAYPLFYGGIGGPSFNHLIIPVILAFLLNFSREIIKDLQDVEGDSAVGLVTSAILPASFTKATIVTNSVIYLTLVSLPFFLNQLGILYLIVCIVGTLPVHFYRTTLLLHTSWPQVQLKKVASLYKTEMLCGLFALLLDKSSRYFM